MSRSLLLFLFITLSSGYAAQAQAPDCEQILNQADEEFKAGRFFSIPTMLKPCLETGFTNEQKVRAYLILTQSYLILDDPIAAEDSYLKLLKADPEYVANPARDPIDVYYLSKKFTSTPIFTPHFRIGLNTSRPRDIHLINTSGAPLDQKEIFKVGFQVGAGIDWNVDNNWSVCAELDYATKSFKREVRNYAQTDIQTSTEALGGFDIPLYIKYSRDSGVIRPFAYAGYALNFLLSAKEDLIFDNYTPSNPAAGIKKTTGPREDIYFKRNFFTQSIVLGIGAKYKIGKDFLYGDIRYMMGLSNFTKPEQVYYDKDGLFDKNITNYQYVSDYFRLDNLQISVGYIHPIYDPRKKTDAKFGGLFKKKTSTPKQDIE
jgi:Outer membrane protein beta-barrel domain